MWELKGQSVSIFVVTAVFLVISLISVVLRCFVRIKLVKSFGWDDILMVIAMACNVLFATCGMVGAAHGMGRHLWDFQHFDDIQTALFWWWLGQSSYVFTCTIAKVSIALAMLRLTVRPAHAIVVWIIIGVTTVIGVVFFFILTFQCTPVNYFWMRFSSSGTCLEIDSVLAIAYLYSVTACLCDLALGIFPIVLIRALQMDRRSKIAVAGILAMGCIASAAVVVRIPYLQNYKDSDFLYATASISVWSNVEAGLGISAGSLITLRPLFRWFRESSGYLSRSNKQNTSDVPLSESANKLSSSNRFSAKSWRNEIEPKKSGVVITTIHASSHERRSSSQENLYPRHGEIFQGGNLPERAYQVSGGHRN